MIPTTIEVWPIERFRPYEKNPRKNDHVVDQMAASIRQFGFKIPMLAKSDGEVVDGHLRLKGAKREGLTELPVILCDEWTEAQVKAFRLMVNKSVEWADWDSDLLKVELGELQKLDFDLALTGFELEETSGLLDGSWAPPERETLRPTRVPPAVEQPGDEDATPEAPVQPVTLAGDIWLLGNHRLMCGDSTSTETVETLMDGGKAHLVFTDPPYNVDYEGYTGEKLKIQGDKMDAAQFTTFLQQVFFAYARAVLPTASLYVCHPSSWQREFQSALEVAGFHVRTQIIWAKNTFAWGFSRYKFQHEPIFYAHVAENKDAWYGDKSQSTLWQEKKPAANRLHPTMKPVELVERAIVNSSQAGEIVLDLFGGSGSTLIAAHKNGRVARLMELDPKYCDVIVQRWQEFSGQTASLAASGFSFAELRATRAAA